MFLSAGSISCSVCSISVGQILEDYDTDKKFPVYGFGASVGRNVNHCFPLTFDESNPEVERVGGIMDAYIAALGKVTLAGPTLFSEVLQMASALAQEPSTGAEQKYTVLLIITDGIINDSDQATRLIVEGAKLPLSIIIVGVGGADFTEMEILDGDEKRLSYDGVKAERDIVQFVPFRDFKNKSYTALAEHTLEELPREVTGYFGKKGIKPNPPCNDEEEPVMQLTTLNAETPPWSETVLDDSPQMPLAEVMTDIKYAVEIKDE